MPKKPIPKKIPEEPVPGWNEIWIAYLDRHHYMALEPMSQSEVKGGKYKKLSKRSRKTRKNKKSRKVKMTHKNQKEREQEKEEGIPSSKKYKLYISIMIQLYIRINCIITYLLLGLRRGIATATGIN